MVREIYFFMSCFSLLSFIMYLMGVILLIWRFCRVVFSWLVIGLMVLKIFSCMVFVEMFVVVGWFIFGLLVIVWVFFFLVRCFCFSWFRIWLVCKMMECGILVILVMWILKLCWFFLVVSLCRKMILLFIFLMVMLKLWMCGNFLVNLLSLW